jgi:lipoyl(octanoyl) transferase
VVRRPTGGKAILHTDELTYSVITPQTDPRVEGGIIESYRRLSEGLSKGLTHLGLIAQSDKKNDDSNKTANKENPVCFEVPSNYEITVIGKKLVGSAQARKQGVVLQHGTLPLTGDLTRICDALAFESEAAQAEAKQRVVARAITLGDALGQTVTWQAAANAMKHGFREALHLQFETGQLTEAEWAKAHELRETRYTQLT